MKLGILSFLIAFALLFYLYKSKQVEPLIQMYVEQITRKINAGLFYFDVFDIRYPESYINNDKLLGLRVRDIEDDAYKVYPILKKLKQKDYFRIFKVNLNKPCTILKTSGKCLEQSKCTVCECDDDKIPYNFRTNEIEIIEDKLVTEDLKKTFTENELYSDILGVYSDNENDGDTSYVDLIYNSPSFTAYQGKPIWDLIYKENCFIEDKNPCKEMKNFYNIISGMQSNIATLSSEYYHLKNEHVLNKKKNDKFSYEHYPELKYDYNIKFFKNKIGLYPDRIENLYFTFAILLRAVCRLKTLFKQCKCNTGFEQNDKEAVLLLNELLESNYHICSSKQFSEPLFPTQGKQILTKFRNIIKILDCVPCVKCRLHGKLKTTALQIALVEGIGQGHIGSLERNEITAAINALFYFADSIKILKKFEERLKLRRMLFIIYFLSFIFFKILLFYSIIFLFVRRYKKKLKENQLKKDN